MSTAKEEKSLEAQTQKSRTLTKENARKQDSLKL